DCAAAHSARGRLLSRPLSRVFSRWPHPCNAELRRHVMGTKKMDETLRTSIDRALVELEAVSDEIRIKIHLAGMDARDAWDTSLEPRLEQARAHAQEAKEASKKAIDETLTAFRKFSAVL